MDGTLCSGRATAFKDPFTNETLQCQTEDQCPKGYVCRIGAFFGSCCERTNEGNARVCTYPTMYLLYITYTLRTYTHTMYIVRVTHCTAPTLTMHTVGDGSFQSTDAYDDHNNLPLMAHCNFHVSLWLCVLCYAAHHHFTELYRRNYNPTCGSGKKVHEIDQGGFKTALLGAACDDGFCPEDAECQQGEILAYCCKGTVACKVCSSDFVCMYVGNSYAHIIGAEMRRALMCIRLRT